MSGIYVSHFFRGSGDGLPEYVNNTVMDSRRTYTNAAQVSKSRSGGYVVLIELLNFFVCRAIQLSSQLPEMQMKLMMPMKRTLPLWCSTLSTGRYSNIEGIKHGTCSYCMWKQSQFRTTSFRELRMTLIGYISQVRLKSMKS